MTDQALDDLLRQVLLDAEVQEYGDMMELLPEHDFSPDFERKMKKLIRRANHPIRHRVAQAAACFLLAVLLSGCTVLAISPEAREAFAGWVREVYEGWFVYRYTGKAQTAPENVVYCPTWLPNGYTETSSPDLYEQEVTIYENADGSLLIFGYSKSMGVVGLYVSQDDAVIKQTTVWGNKAELYLYPTIEDAFNYLVWVDDNSGLIFWLVTSLDESALLQVAESVEAVQYISVNYEP